MLLRDLRPSRAGCCLVPILLVLFGATASAQEYPDLDHVGEKTPISDFDYDDDELYEDRSEAEAGVDDVPTAEEAEGEGEVEVAEEVVDEDAPAPGVEVIVVTANRRTEDLQKVAVSVTALKGSFIEEVGLTDFEDIQKFTPNLQILSQGDSRSTSIRIRGIGSVGSNAGIDPSVGVFIDGVYQGRAGMSVQDLMDIDAVEVLRGPQGTLYGKNTAAGALKITSRTPNYEPSAMLEFVGGNYTNIEGRFTGNIPIIEDKLATRLTGYGVTHDGYERNFAPIHLDDRGVAQDINDTTRWGLRSSTLWDVTDEVSILLRGDYAEVHEHCCTADTWKYGEPGDSLLVSAQELAARYTPPLVLFEDLNGDGIGEAVAGDRKVAVDLLPKNDVGVGGVSLEGTVIRWEHIFTSLTAYRHYDSDSIFDGDFSEMDAIGSTTQVDLDQVSTELRVVSPKFDKFDYVAGFYFFYSDMKTHDILGFSENYINLVFGGNDSSENTGNNNHETTSAAGYADANLHLSEFWGDEPNITLTGGIRVGWEEKKHLGSQIATGFLADSGLETPISGPDAFSDQKADDTYVTGRAILKWEPDFDWEPIESSMIYASYATGYKSGGFNQLRTAGQATDENLLFFAPEESQSIEGGLRSTWLNRLITFNMTGYYTDYNDFQSQVFDGLGIRVINAGSFKTYGFEADVTVVPLPGWITVFSAGYTITEYTEFDQGPCTQQELVRVGPSCVQDLAGKPLDNTPVWDLGLFSSYERELPIPDIDDVNWFVMMNYNYQTERYLNAALDPFLKVSPTHLLGFRAGLRHPNARWEVSAWIKNVTDEDFWAVGFDVPTLGGYAAFQSPPRTFGGTVRVKFW